MSITPRCLSSKIDSREKSSAGIYEQLTSIKKAFYYGTQNINLFTGDVQTEASWSQ